MLLCENPVEARYFAIVDVNCPAADSGAPTDLTISGVTTAIQNKRRDGKTCTLLGALCLTPAYNATGTAAYPTGDSVFALAVSTSTLTGTLSDSTATSVTALAAWATAGVTPAQILVNYTLA